jgi:hypothetical protein
VISGALGQRALPCPAGADGAGDVFGVFGVFIVVAVEPVGFVFFGVRFTAEAPRRNQDYEYD